MKILPMYHMPVQDQNIYCLRFLYIKSIGHTSVDRLTGSVDSFDPICCSMSADNVSYWNTQVISGSYQRITK